MVNYPTLYKRTSVGKVQQWSIEQDGARYRVTSGQADGKKVTSEWKIAKAKNVGKANEVDPVTQAGKEIAARYTKQRESGYFDDINEIDNIVAIKPMLAKGYEPKRLTGGPYFVQPKLDGIRALIGKDFIMTRNWKPIVTVPHIREALEPFFEDNPFAVLDGELYNHDLREDFNSIVSAVRKQKPTDDDFTQSRNLIEYHVYDTVVDDVNFSDRFPCVAHALRLTADTSIEIVDAVATDSVDEIDELHGTFIEQGYEGSMIRLDAPYESKRSATLLKRKDFVDDEFVIVDVEEGEGNRSGMAGRIILEMDDGKRFQSAIIGGVKRNREILRNKDNYIGCQATVKYFNLTPDGIPRFPSVKDIHVGKRVD